MSRQPAIFCSLRSFVARPPDFFSSLLTVPRCSEMVGSRPNHDGRWRKTAIGDDSGPPTLSAMPSRPVRANLHLAPTESSPWTPPSSPTPPSPTGQPCAGPTAPCRPLGRTQHRALRIPAEIRPRPGPLAALPPPRRARLQRARLRKRRNVAQCSPAPYTASRSIMLPTLRNHKLIIRHPANQPMLVGQPPRPPAGKRAPQGFRLARPCERPR